MKKKLHFSGNRCVLFLLVFFFSQTSISQISLNFGVLEAGVTFSPSNFLGDLGGTYGKGEPFLKDNNVSNTKLLIGAHFSAYPTDWLGFRLAVTHGTIAGDDAIIKGKGGLEEARKARNQNFKSKINEAFIAAEFYPSVFMEHDATQVFNKIRPYGLIGIGLFHFDPKGQDPLTGEWINLKSLHTEGQGFPEYPERKDYKLTQLNIPMGVGIKYFANETVSLSLEVVHRKTFSDYIDDVSTDYIDKDLFYKNLPLNTAIIANRMYDKSTNAANRNGGDKRGTSSNMDAYYSAGFKLSYRISGSSSGNYRSSTLCPVIRY